MDCIYCHEHDQTLHCNHPNEVYKGGTNYRDNPMASTSICRFKLGVQNRHQEKGPKIFYLIPEGKLVEFTNLTKLLSPATAGIFMFEEKETYTIVKYLSTSPIRFSFYIALYDGLEWGIQLRGVYTRNGIAFKNRLKNRFEI